MDFPEPDGPKGLAQLADVREWIDLLRVLVPAWVEGQDVLLEHPLEQSNDVVTVLEDRPVLRDVPTERLEAKLLIKLFGCLDVLHCETDGECAELHGDLQWIG